MALSSFSNPVDPNPKGLATHGFVGEGNAIDNFGILTFGFIWQITSIWCDADAQITTSWTDVDFAGTTTWTDVDFAGTTTWTAVDVPPDETFLKV